MKALYLIPFFMTVALIVWWNALPKIEGSSAWGVQESLRRGFTFICASVGITITVAVIALIDWWLDLLQLIALA